MFFFSQKILYHGQLSFKVMFRYFCIDFTVIVSLFSSRYQIQYDVEHKHFGS